MFKKILLIVVGYIFPVIVVNYYFVVVLLFLTTLITFLLSKIKVIFFSSDRFIKYFVPIFFLIIIFLNIKGYITTLTGIHDNTKISLIFVGFTFYLLNAGAYVVDAKPNINKGYLSEFVDLSLYIVLPFKFLAGPLENTDLIKQFEKISFKNSFSKIKIATSWIILGLFMKFVIAHRLTPLNLINETKAIESFICAFVFELKFYFDFAGYSFIAYGLAMLANLKLTLNFNHPFTSRNVVIFWHNWHISLGKFLQRYVLYKNVGIFGSRSGKILFASSIFLLSAMWHGGTLNYLLWGTFHGSVYCIFIVFFKKKNINSYFSVVAMFLFFVIGRMFAIDISSHRLVEKIISYFNYKSYIITPERFYTILEASIVNVNVYFIILLFLSLEFFQVYKLKKQKYHLFRRPILTIPMFIFILIFGYNTGELLYARF